MTQTALVNPIALQLSPELQERLNKETQAAAKAVEEYGAYKDSIDSEEMYLFVGGVLKDLKGKEKEIKRQLEDITKPMVRARADVLTAKQKMENLFAPFFKHAETAERILKDEIVRYERIKAAARQQKLIEQQLKLDEEKRLKEQEAQRVAEESARQHQADIEIAERLETEGKAEEAQEKRSAADVNLEISTAQVEAKLMEADAISETAPAIADVGIKLAGITPTKKYHAEIVNITELLLGLAENPSMLTRSLRGRVGTRLVDLGPYLSNPESMKELEGLELHMPNFHQMARDQMEHFSVRGMRAVAVEDVRVTA